MTNKATLTDTERKIGLFMVAAGAIIEDVDTGKILMVKRTDDFRKGEWELTYGRIDQHEDLDVGLRREIKEETGLDQVTIKRFLRTWHMYRGEKVAENEIHGFSFHVQVKNPVVKLSEEHDEYRWVTLQEAMELLVNKGIKFDIQFWLETETTRQTAITGLDHQLKETL